MDQPGSIVDGWAAAVHLDFGLRGGLIAVALYLECGTGIGADTENWRRLMKVGEVLSHFGRPFIVGGDFNTSPAELAQSGWPAGIQGRVQATGALEVGTCRSSQGNWSNIDFFVLSRHRQEAVLHLHTVGSEPPRPHLPLRLKLNAKPKEYKERVLKRIKQFPLETPTGPTPRPPDWNTEEITAGKTGQDRANALHGFLVQGIEVELANAYGIEVGA